MPKCPNCPKFTEKNVDIEPEERFVDIDSDGGARVEYELFNECSECGTQLESATFEMEYDFTSDVADHKKDKHENGDISLSLSADASRIDRTQTHDRRGKPLHGPMRYRKRYYGVEAHLVLTCDTCGETIAETNVSDEMPASAFDSQV